MYKYYLVRDLTINLYLGVGPEEKKATGRWQWTLPVDAMISCSFADMNLFQECSQ